MKNKIDLNIFTYKYKLIVKRIIKTQNEFIFIKNAFSI